MGLTVRVLITSKKKTGKGPYLQESSDRHVVKSHVVIFCTLRTGKDLPLLIGKSSNGHLP